MKKAAVAFLLCICIMLSLVGCTTRAAVAQHPIVTAEELAAYYEKHGIDPEQAVPAAELMPVTPAPTAAAGTAKKSGGMLSFLKKETPAPDGAEGLTDENDVPVESASPDPSDPSATPAPGATATPVTGILTVTATPSASSGTSASPSASASPTATASNKITATDIAGVLNTAFAQEGYSDIAVAYASGSTVNVEEKTSIPYSEYQEALETDPDGEVVTEVTAYLSEEVAYWTDLFSSIVAETGFSGRFVMMFVFSDGVSYTGLDITY